MYTTRAPRFNGSDSNIDSRDGSSNIDNETSASSEKKNARKSESIFLYQLHMLIEASEQTAAPPIISWAPDGDGFVLHNQTEFVDNLLPIYFDQMSKIESFTRALNRAGILKLAGSKGTWRQKEGKFFRGSHPATNRPHVANGSIQSSGGIDESEGRARKNSAKEDKELAAFFVGFAESITDEMLDMDPDQIVIVRSRNATICVPRPQHLALNRSNSKGTDHHA